jgi:hypothetical protein
LFHDGIPFLLQPVLLWPFDVSNQTLWRDSFHQVIPSRYIMQESVESVLAVCGNNPFTGDDPGYHGNAQSQIIIADNWYTRIKNDFNLV